jgi:hypothetical protein
MQLLLRCDSLLVLCGERLQLCLPGRFTSRHTLRKQLVLVGVVVGSTAPAVAGFAVRPAPTRLAAVEAEVDSAVITPQRGQGLG